MKYIKSGNTYVVRMEKGDELFESLLSLAKNEKIKFGSVSGIGATNCVDFGCFDTEKKQYKNIHLENDFEITSICGNISTMDGESYVHLHINVSDSNGSVYGGHLKSAVISVTAEIVVTAFDAVVDRIHDAEVGANVFNI